MNRYFRVRMGLVRAVVIAVLAVVAPQVLANDVVAMKHALYGAGYNVGNVNGVMDDVTRNALRKFQRDQGTLVVSGELDEATKRALGMMAAPAAEPVAVREEVSAEPEGLAESPVEAVADTVITEDEDGGWSLF